jgi:pimeloyl-ACP methyl ester carboxylesterase
VRTITRRYVAGVPHGGAVDGFRLAYDRTGDGPPVVALHGWPGSRRDYRDVVAALAGSADVVVPDLRGFGDSDRHDAAPEAYSADGQAASVLGLIDELGLDRPVLVGYDIGSRIAQAAARRRPDAVRALVLSPPLPGVGDRVLTPDSQREFWYQPFHRLALSEELIDGRRDAVGAYLRHFWEHWSAAGWSPEPAELEALADLYARPGAFAASIAWYRAGAGTIAVALTEEAPAPADRLAVPATVLWPTEDPLFPVAWADRLDDFLADAELRVLEDVGHFVPLEAPGAVAAAIRVATGTSA